MHTFFPGAASPKNSKKSIKIRTFAYKMLKHPHKHPNHLSFEPSKTTNFFIPLWNPSEKNHTVPSETITGRLGMAWEKQQNTLLEPISSNLSRHILGRPQLASRSWQLARLLKAELLLCVVFRHLRLDNLAARFHRVRLEGLRCWLETAHGALSAAMTKRTACETQWNPLRNTVKRALRCETHSETHSETQHKTL